MDNYGMTIYFHHFFFEFWQILNRYLSQIKDSHKTSALVQDLEKKESEFDRLCQKYEASVAAVPEITG